MDSSLITIFTTGLLTGGLTCLAVQGGLLASALAQQEELRLENGDLRKDSNVLPIISFVIAKLIAYTIFGFFLGWLGSLLDLSLQARILLQAAVVVFMLGTAFNLLNVHPFFRYFVIQPPRFLTRLIRKQSKSSSVFAPALLGAFTIFIPCGTTQAIMALAVASGNPVTGALMMFVFILGTSPLFFILGLLTMTLGDVLHQRFMKVAAFVLILLALFNLDATIALTGSQHTIRNFVKEGYCLVSYCERFTIVTPVTEQNIIISAKGYSPNYFAVKAGSKVTLHLTNQGALNCAQAFTIPALRIQKLVQNNKTGDITFVAPATPGRITFTCSMGMYPGTIEVVE
jgi:sulfite exporter TauE/SafE